MARIPMIIEAHKIIDAIREIWFPTNKQALKNLSNPLLKSNLFFKLKKSKMKPNKMEIDAEY